VARGGFFVGHFGAGLLSGRRPKEPVLAGRAGRGDATTTIGRLPRRGGGVKKRAPEQDP